MLGRIVGQVLLAGEEAHEGAPAHGGLVADRAPQLRVAVLEGVEDRRRGDEAVEVEVHLPLDLGQGAQVGRQHHPYHASVWASTDSTGGRFLTTAVQLSPSSAEAYTCPPVVPKWSPHGSRESTAMESRSTLT